MLIAEADGSTAEAQHLRSELLEAFAPGRAGHPCAEGRGEIRELWRWRSGVSLAVIAGPWGQGVRGHRRPAGAAGRGHRGNARDRRPARAAGMQLGARRDGNLHSTFMIDLEDPAEAQRLSAGRPGSVHPRGSARRLGLRRARNSAWPSVARWRVSGPSRRWRYTEQIKGRVRPQGVAEPGEEAGPVARPRGAALRPWRGQHRVHVRPPRAQEREQLEPVAPLMRIEIGDEHRGRSRGAWTRRGP